MQQGHEKGIEEKQSNSPQTKLLLKEQWLFSCCDNQKLNTFWRPGGFLSKQQFQLYVTFLKKLFIIHAYTAMCTQARRPCIFIQLQSEKYSPACHTRGTGAIGLRPTTYRETKIVYSKHTLLLVSVFIYTYWLNQTHTEKYRNTHTFTQALTCS